jgi:hypothetical protein
MTIFLLLLLLLALAGAAGWGVDSRDVRFGLWPLNGNDQFDDRIN